MNRATAATFALPLLAIMTVSAAPPSTTNDGPCFATRPLPALASGTRVFVLPGLRVKLNAAATARTGEAVAAKNVRVSGATIVSTSPSEFDVNGSAEAAPHGVPVLTNERITVVPTAMICAYPPGAEPPAWLSGTTPDMVIP
jgi:hypothetical protein